LKLRHPPASFVSGRETRRLHRCLIAAVIPRSYFLSRLSSCVGPVAVLLYDDLSLRIRVNIVNDFRQPLSGAITRIKPARAAPIHVQSGDSMSAASTTIAVLDDYQHIAARLADWASLQPRANTVFFHDHIADRDALAARLAPFDAIVLVRERTRFDAELIARLPKLKLLVTIGMWNAAIDFHAAKARGIVVSGTNASEPAATPALTWGLILAITRNLHGESASVRAGGWQTSVGVDVHGKTLGVLGLGTIGQQIARFGTVFGMNVIAWSPNLTPERAAEAGAKHVDKATLFREADVISIHLKLGERSHGLVGAAELASMKPTAYLVNTSRGPIVSEPALIEALQTRRIAGAALDVFDEEPLPPTHPYRFLPNVLATPHIGYVTENTYRGAYPQIVESIHAWLAGAPVRELHA
jgi:phosphoglycerate dehydrogenase-like enzyme